MQRNLVTKVLVAVVGFAVFAAAGWAISAATQDDQPVAAPATSEPHDGSKMVKLPTIQVTSGFGDTPAKLAYTAPKGAKPPTSKPENPPAPAPRPAGSSGASSSVLVPARSLPPLDPQDTRPRRPDTDGTPPTTAAPGTTAPSSTTRSGASSGASTSSTTPPAPSTPTTTLPAVQDGCAADPRPVGCPLGIGGTILPAGGGHPFLILNAEPVTGPGCPSTGLDRNHFALTITSSEPGAFSITQTSDQTGQRRTRNVSTSETEIDRWHSAGEAGEVATCVLLSGSSSDRSFTLVIHGVPTGEGSTTGADFTTQITPAISGHAPVTFRPFDDSNGVLVVGSKPDELVEAVLVERPDGSTGSSCDALDSDRQPIGFAPRALRDQAPTDDSNVVVASSPFGGDFPRIHEFDVHLERSDLYDVCLTSKRDLQPRAEVTERESFTVQPPARSSVHLSIDGFDVHQPRPGSNVDMNSLLWADVDVTELDGTELCNTSVSRSIPSRPLCDIPSTGLLPAVRISVDGRFMMPGQSRQERGHYEGVLDFADENCNTSAGCNGSARLPILMPDSTTESMGDVTLQIASTPAPVRASLPDWDFQSGGTFGHDEGVNSQDPNPQLVASETRFLTNPNDPFHVTVRWKADRPASAQVSMSSSMFPGQPGCGLPWTTGVHRGATRTLGPDEGEATFDVCPGSNYAASIRLESTADHKVTWLVGPGMSVPTNETAEFVRVPWNRGALRTPAVTLDVNFSSQFRKAEWDGTSAYLLDGDTYTRLGHVDWWFKIGDQILSQSRRSGVIVQNSPTCIGYPGFDLAPGALNPNPIRVVVGPRLEVLLQASYTDYAQCRAVTQAAVGSPSSSGVVQGALEFPVYQLIHDGHATMTANSYGGHSACSRCVGLVTTDIQARQVP